MEELQASRERQVRLKERLQELEELERQSFQDLEACRREMERKEQIFKDIQLEETARQQKAIEDYEAKLEAERNRLIHILTNSRIGRLN